MRAHTSKTGHRQWCKVEYLWLAFLLTITATLGNMAASFFYDVAKALISGTTACTDDACRDIWVRDLVRQVVLGLVTFGAAIALAVFQVIPAVREGFFRSMAVIRRNEAAEPRRALILTLSNLDLNKGPDAAWIASAAELARSAADEDARRAALVQFCDAGGAWGGWRWQQPLRVIAKNRERLEAVAFVLTPEAAPQYARLMAPLLDSLLRPGTRVFPAPHAAEKEAGAVDLSEYNNVTSALDRACAEVTREGGLTTADICIDISGGTKAYTAAATVKTLNSAMVFSYVETRESPRVGEVAIYDASIVG